MFYNISKDISRKIINLIESKDFKKVFSFESIFAGYFESGDNTIFLRDTLGIVPLHYRIDKDEIQISIKITDLIKKGDKINKKGAVDFISFGSTRISPIIENINICPPGSIMQFNKKRKKLSILYKNKIHPRNLNNINENNILEEYKELFSSAISKNRTKKNQVIFLSGGIDSACIALKDKNILDAITILPWGKNSSEKESSKKNAKIADIKSHQFIDVNEKVLNKNIPELIKKYGTPLGTIHYLIMDHAFSNNFLSKYSSIAFGQNLDTLSCAAGSQPTSILLPSIIRKKIFKEKNVVNFFLKINTGHLSSENQEIIDEYISDDLTEYQKIILSGIFITHTPLDSEYFVLPSLVNNRKIFNPYYDQKIVEFFLGLKKKLYLDFSRKTWKFPIKIDKQIQKKLWEYLSNNKKFQQKKGLYLSSQNILIKDILKSTPKFLEGKPIKLENQRFAAKNFIDFCKEYDLENPISFTQ